MTFKLAAVLATQFVFIGLLGVSAAETGAPAPVARIGSTEKVCQLTGDTDWETGRPTAGRTFSNFGLDATDLGYPVEHAGKLILLFRDSWPPRHPDGAIREVPPDDAVGVVTRRVSADGPEDRARIDTEGTFSHFRALRKLVAYPYLSAMGNTSTKGS